MGITLRGIGGLGQRPGELGGQELRSKIKKEINSIPPCSLDHS